MKIFKLILLFLSLLVVLTSCSGIKEGLQGNNKNSKDEFLVEKKNPLTEPPDFDELPKPVKKKVEEIASKEADSIKKLLKKYEIDSDKEVNNENVKSIEESILKKINEN
jgi:hypothetical protein